MEFSQRQIKAFTVGVFDIMGLDKSVPFNLILLVRLHYLTVLKPI